jgi:cytochrome P450
LITTELPGTEPLLDFFGRPVPPHVPRELVRRIDVYRSAETKSDPFAVIRQLREGPPLIYNLHNATKGQCWLPTRAKDIRSILGSPTLFSSKEQANFSALIGEKWRLGLVEMDPPDHTKFRQLVNPWLAPPAVAKLSGQVRLRAIELIDAVADHGGCDFISSFGTPFPVSIFLELMGLPNSHAPRFLQWIEELLHADDPSIMAKGARSIADYLRSLIAERRRQSVDDLVSRAVNLQIDGKPLTDDDLLGLCFLLFVGGLDTVAGALGFHFYHLATHPEHQDRLRQNPGDIPNAVEEYLRYFSSVLSHRQATADTEIAGVTIKKGDWISIFNALASLDPSEFENPDNVDFDRRQIRHFAFSFGPHFCVGSHLARRELKIAIEEWTTRLPPFRLASGSEQLEGIGGVGFQLNRLMLEW